MKLNRGFILISILDKTHKENNKIDIQCVVRFLLQKNNHQSFPNSNLLVLYIFVAS